MKARLVQIDLLDHGEGPGSDLTPFPCSVVGWLFKEDKNHYWVASWVYNGEPESDDSKVFTIVKTAVVEKRWLR